MPTKQHTKKPVRKQRFHLEIDSDLIESLKKIKSENGSSHQFIINKALREYLAKSDQKIGM